jgi:hypothetical protein
LDAFEKVAAERREAQRQAKEEEEKRRKEDEQRWRAMAFMPRKEEERRGPAAAQPVPGPLFEITAPRARFIYDPRPPYVPTPRHDASALVLARICKEAEERNARMAGGVKRKLSDLDEEEWRTRGDYPECREHEEREAKRRRKGPRSFLWTVAKWMAGAWAVGRLFGVC